MLTTYHQSCGEELWDDYKVLQPGAMEELRKYLHHVRPTQARSHGHGTSETFFVVLEVLALGLVGLMGVIVLRSVLVTP